MKTELIFSYIDKINKRPELFCFSAEGISVCVADTIKRYESISGHVCLVEVKSEWFVSFSGLYGCTKVWGVFADFNEAKKFADEKYGWEYHGERQTLREWFPPTPSEISIYEKKLERARNSRSSEWVC